MADIDIDDFLRDRHEALMSLDLAKVNKYRVKYGEKPMPDTEAARAAIHKARTIITTFPEEEKIISRAWLTDHGYKIPVF